ncbi:TIGR02594 family protein [Enterobacter asburiae]|uniref:TIGR02594 family protein n=1 Tax=Enterobacter asburiae TaxID=61645 RepID=UPI00192C2F73|nr:TIGR02594 family protein [Enterobacter asburiae]MBL5914650.1 TIGR02594 family protein [Enterobacter asburiae]MBL5919131.1 TIGR02594 family protein [Enterobacter asburiae]
MAELKWIAEARKYIGEREIKGGQHNPLILQWWKDIKRGGIKDDETPWCAAYAGAMLERSGVRSTRFESAKSYLDWGIKLDRPVYGCVVVFTREGGGHVGFVVGKTQVGDLLVLGGNQGDAVNIRAFSASRVSGYRWPLNEYLECQALSVMNAPDSTSEA